MGLRARLRDPIGFRLLARTRLGIGLGHRILLSLSRGVGPGELLVEVTADLHARELGQIAGVRTMLIQAPEEDLEGLRAREDVSSLLAPRRLFVQDARVHERANGGAPILRRERAREAERAHEDPVELLTTNLAIRPELTSFRRQDSIPRRGHGVARLPGAGLQV